MTPAELYRMAAERDGYKAGRDDKSVLHYMGDDLPLGAPPAMYATQCDIHYATTDAALACMVRWGTDDIEIIGCGAYQVRVTIGLHIGVGTCEVVTDLELAIYAAYKDAAAMQALEVV